jgi:hypothetical protein
MIRRNVLHNDWDHLVVKWSLIAALVALSAGMLAETRMVRAAAEPATGTEVVEAVVPAGSHGSG